MLLLISQLKLCFLGVYDGYYQLTVPSKSSTVKSGPVFPNGLCWTQSIPKWTLWTPKSSPSGELRKRPCPSLLGSQAAGPLNSAGQYLWDDDSSAGNFRETTTIITQATRLPGKQLCLRTEAKTEVGGCVPLLSTGGFTPNFVHISRMFKLCSGNPWLFIT
jgi:hypothetical protein